MITLEIVEADLKEFSEKKLNDFIGDYHTPSEVINKNVKFGWVKVNGEKRYALLYEVIGDILLVTGALSNKPNGSFLKTIFPCIENFATSLGCKQIHYHTEKLGMIKFGAKNDYKIESVKLVKRL